MRISLCGAATLLIIFTQISVAAFAQQTLDNNGAAANGMAPVYSQHNFKADARADNLYSYKNPLSKKKQPWNNFQMQVKQLQAQAAAAAEQRIQSAPQTSGAAGPTAGYNGVSALSGFAGSLFSSVAKPNLSPAAGNAASDKLSEPNSAAQSAGPDLQESASVNGSLRQAENVPGLLPQ